MNKVWTYYWMNIIQISHLLINMCVKCVFNAQYQSVKCINYEWMNFAQFPLQRYEMLSLWCRFENVDCKRSKQLEIIFQVMISCELGQDISFCWWLLMWLKWGMIFFLLMVIEQVNEIIHVIWTISTLHELMPCMLEISENLTMFSSFSQKKSMSKGILNCK
jgi:hypothetical protein